MKTSYLRQFLGTLIMSFPMFLVGSGSTWPSYAFQILHDKNTPLISPLTFSEISLIGSMSIFSTVLAPPIAGIVISKMGRRLSGVLNNIILAVWWLFAIFARTPLMLIIGRIIFGITVGLGMQVSLSFAAEVSEDPCRGLMSCIPLILVIIGRLVFTHLCWIFGYFGESYVNLALTMISSLMIMWIPESPVCLRLKGKGEEALVSLAYYRATTVDDKALLDEMAQNSTIKPETSDPEKKDSAKEEFIVPAKTGLRYFLNSPASRWSSSVVAILMTLSILSGSTAIQIYGSMLMYRYLPYMEYISSYDILTGTLILGLIFAAPFTDLFGRWVLLMSAATVNGICLAILALSFGYLQVPEWIIPTLFITFNLAYSLGGGTIPFVLLAEVFVPEVKCFAQSIILTWMYIATFVVMMFSMPAIDFIGFGGACFVFAGCAFSCALFTYFMLPETKGKNPYVIEEMFAKRIKQGRRWAKPSSDENNIVGVDHSRF